MFINKRKTTSSVTLTSNKCQTLLKNRSKKIILKHNCSVLSKSDISELKDAFNPNLPTKLVAIHGPIGCGKTYIVNELAKQTNHTISIFDPSSDCKISEELQSLTATKNKFKKNINQYKIMFIDDVDALPEQQVNRIVEYMQTEFNPTQCCNIIISYTSSTKIKSLIDRCNIDIEISAPSVDQLLNFAQGYKTVTHEHKTLCAVECNGDIRQFMRMVGIVDLDDSVTILIKPDQVYTPHDAIRKMLEYPDQAPTLTNTYCNSKELTPLLWNATTNVYAQYDLDIGHMASVQSSLNNCNIKNTYETYDFNNELNNAILGIVPVACEIPYTSDISSHHVQSTSQIAKLSKSYLLYK